jgi:uroporphyrinogen-III synthase
MSLDNTSLLGKRVVLPRTQPRPSRIAAALRAYGVEVYEIVAGDHGPDWLEPPADLMLFASSGSVAAAGLFLARLRGANRLPHFGAMGPESAAALRAVGFEPDEVAPEPTLDALVDLGLAYLQRP